MNTRTQFGIQSVSQKSVRTGWATFNLMGNSPKTSTRAIRRKMERLASRAAKTGGRK